MSTVLMENRYRLTEKDIREYVGLFTYRTPIFMAFMVIVLILAIANTVSLLSGDSGRLPIVLVNFGMAFLFVAIMIYIDRKNTKALVLRERKRNDGQIAERIIRITDHFENRNGLSGETQSIDFRGVDKCRTTKHLVVLSTPKKVNIIIKKDSFTIGTYDDFVRFIKETYPNFKLSEK